MEARTFMNEFTAAFILVMFIATWLILRAIERLSRAAERIADATEKLAQDYRPPSAPDDAAYKTGGV